MADEYSRDPDQSSPTSNDPLAKVEAGPGDETVRVIPHRPLDATEPPDTGN